MAKKQKPAAASPGRTDTTKSKPAQAALQPTNKTWSPWIYSLLLVVLALALYSNTFEHRFVLDDHGIIKNNKIINILIISQQIRLI